MQAASLRLVCPCLSRTPRPLRPRRLLMALWPSALLLLLLMSSTVTSLPADVTGRLLPFATRPPSPERENPSAMSLLFMGLLPAITSGRRRPVPRLTSGHTHRARPDRRLATPGIVSRRTGLQGTTSKPDTAGAPAVPRTQTGHPSPVGSQRPRVVIQDGDSGSRLVNNSWEHPVSYSENLRNTHHKKNGGKPYTPQPKKAVSVSSFNKFRPDDARNNRKSSLPSSRLQATQLSIIYPVTLTSQPRVVQSTSTKSTVGKSAVAGSPTLSLQRLGPQLNSHQSPQRSSHSSATTRSPYSPELSPHYKSDFSSQTKPWLMPQLRRNYSSLINYRRGHRLAAEGWATSRTAVPHHLINWDHPSLTGADGGLGGGQPLDTGSQELLGALTGRAKEKLSDVIKALTQFHLIRGSLLPASGGRDDIHHVLGEERCYRACARADFQPPGSSDAVDGGLKATVTILLWASLATVAAWVGPSIGSGSIFNTRSSSTCNTLGGIFGQQMCPQLEGLYQQLVRGLADTYVQLTGGETLRFGRTIYNPAGTNMSRAASNWNLTHSVEDGHSAVTSLFPEYQTAYNISSNDNTSSEGSETVVKRLPRSIPPLSVEGQLESRSVRNTWHNNLTRASDSTISVRGPASSGGWPRGPVSYPSAVAGPSPDHWTSVVSSRHLPTSVPLYRDSASFSGSDVDVDSSTSPASSGSSSGDSSTLRRRQGGPGRRRMRRLWSRMSRAVTWLPRLVSGRLRRFRRWMTSRRAQGSDPGRSTAVAQHQPPIQQWDQQAQQDFQHPPSPERSPALLERRAACACNTLSRKKFRNVDINNALGQFLSTSFWIPALGLVYLLGLSSGNAINNGGSGSGGVTVSETDTVTTTNNDADTLTNTVTITLTNSPTNTNTATQTSSDTTTTTVTDNSMNTNTGGDNTNTNTNNP